MIRKTVLTTAIVGAGLASTAGAAFAGDAPSDNSGSHHSSHASHKSTSGCSTTAVGEINNEGAKTLVGILDGSQGALGLNLCHNLDNNKILADNHFSIAGHEMPQPPKFT
ncbi:hypothetical protein LQ327_03280 [Actinomycetospora endophytica]|uniref:Secreted protein n=1 Tax=Actinomycetospora endophytica TaxID=2291215 RepID=A0ABS8P302_9PSEU|nr:hypothetical protein [Actinomycetospora endophytica]MCD2192418.1 hypothetical protein [Actinomycetospora endophytica]